jgi:hypothetical protein
MSLFYRHLLIPSSAEFRPTAKCLADFVDGMIQNAFVSTGATIAFAKVTKHGPRTRQVRFPTTGETIEIPRPTRSAEKSEQLTDAHQIAEFAAIQAEYDVRVNGEALPVNPPLEVGHVKDGAWQPMDGPYYLQIQCRVRDNVVRLYTLESPDELNRPADIAKYRPRFDEDCSASENVGLFVHPETGPIWIKNAGCGKFWIEFNYGKWLFPRASFGDVSVLNKSVVSLAETTFDTAFVQACDWG